MSKNKKIAFSPVELMVFVETCAKQANIPCKRYDLHNQLGPKVLDKLGVPDLTEGKSTKSSKIGRNANDWLKKAVLLYFSTHDNEVMQGTTHNYYDKVPCRFENATEEDFKKVGARIVPPATVRIGAFLGKNVVVMPSYVNIGAFVDDGTMVDTWVTVGSCAQIGKNVHLSGGVGIGGVLEPLQAAPTIIEDNCFIGARSEVVEGVRIGKGSVLSMGVFISQSTKIYNRKTKEYFTDDKYYQLQLSGSAFRRPGQAAQ